MSNEAIEIFCAVFHITIIILWMLFRCFCFGRGYFSDDEEDGDTPSQESNHRRESAVRYGHRGTSEEDEIEFV